VIHLLNTNLRTCFEFIVKIYYCGKNRMMVLPSPTEREDADRQMGEEFSALKLLSDSFQNCL
jgi:hypothetical protein